MVIVRKKNLPGAIFGCCLSRYSYINPFIFEFLVYNELKIPGQFMVDDSSHQISLLLTDWSKGDEYALEQLMPLVYEELRRMAKNYMRRQPSGHTFQTTELIHEAYLKIAGGEEKQWQNRAHFFGVAAKAMRHILVDFAKSKSRQKRGGWQGRVTFAEDLAVVDSRSEEMIALDEALSRLTAFGERKTQVVEMKFFGGLNTQEIAHVLKISPETVKRDWRFARSWLLRELAHAD
jgi:RNA polymerase sigma-70 factor, ECF subfamily